MKNTTLKQFNRKLLATSILSAALCSQPQAAPLPNYTQLSIDQGVGSATNMACTIGSCFGMEVTPGLVIWTDFGPGTAYGFYVGINQASGGQEAGPSAANNTSGHITNAWNFFANFGTFYTPTGATDNIFGDTSCAGPACIGITQVGSLNVAWNGASVPMGSVNGCNSPSCSPEELAGDHIFDYTFAGTRQPWSIHYHNVVPDGDPSSFGNVKFQFVAKGMSVLPHTPTPPPTPQCTPPPTLIPIPDVSVITEANVPVDWKLTPNPYDLPVGSVECLPGSEPINGTTTFGCPGGTYTPNNDFIGQDLFSMNIIITRLECFMWVTHTYNPVIDVLVGTTTSPTPTPTSTPECTPGPIPVPPPPLDPIFLSTVENQSVTWGSLDDSCEGITIPPTNGTASLSGCQGTYAPFAGFSGNDSLTYNQACYEFTDSCTGTTYAFCTEQQVNIEVLPAPATCEAQYPQTEVTMLGKGKNLEVEETMTTTFKGHIVSTDERTGKVTICRGSTVSYEVTSTVGTANCSVKHGVSAESTGTLTDKGKLVCTNKPDGKDTDKFKIKRSKKNDVAVERRWFR